MPFDRRRGGSQMLMRINLYASFINQLMGLSPLALWDAGAGVYSDAGVTPAAADALVAQFNDQTVNARHVSQGTDAAKPTYRASVAALNNRPALQFDGGDHLLRAVTGGILPGLGNAYGVVSVHTTTSANQIMQYSEGHSSLAPPNIFIDKDANNRARLLHRDDANALALSQGANNTVPIDGSIVIQAGIRTAAANWAVRVNRVQVGTNTVATTTATTITHIALGARYFNGTISAQHVGYLAHVSIYPSATAAIAAEAILEAWYKPPA